jgi:hypothetical protein
VTLTSGRLIGVFFLFVLGTGVGIAGFAGLMWLMKWMKARHKLPDRIEMMAEGNDG